MTYVKEYWDNKKQRAEKAQKWTQTMAKQYPVAIKRAVASTITYSDDYKFQNKTRKLDTEIEIVDMDSVSAIKREAKIIEEEGDDRKLAVLNFASYKNPGGMFINGSKAQEECLCHESFLYNVLRDKPEYYLWNNENKNKALYLNRALYTPNVVFGGIEIGKLCDVITCAAPNKSAAQKYCSVSDKENSEFLKDRIKFVLDIAREEEVDILILGAYGCGVFGQDATEVATIFKNYLTTTHRCFEKVIFAIPDGRDGNLKKFGEVFN